MIVWGELVPAYIADRKKQYDRRRLMSDMRRAGATYSDIAAKFGISVWMARMHVKKFHKEFGRPDPVEEFLRRGGEMASVRKKDRWKFFQTLERFH